MYEEFVRQLREKAGAFDYDGRPDIAWVYEKATDAIEELSKLAEAIPHKCECCVGCELEKKNGGCDNAFVFSPKRAMQYLIKPRWIPVTERLPKYGETVLVYGSQGGIYTARYERARTEWGSDSWWKLNSKSHICNPTHWMPLLTPEEET